MVIGRKSWIAVRIAVAVLGAVSMCVWVTVVPALATSCPNEAFRSGAAEGLPDCRAFEQVSPSNKGGFAGYPLPTQPTIAQVSPSGEKIGYVTYSAFPGALGNTAINAGHVSTRSADAWQTAEWTPAVPKSEVLKTYEADYVFSEDLSQAALQVPLVLLTPEATPNVENLYIRHPEGVYTLVDAAPPALSAEAICGPGLLYLCFRFEDKSTYAGASNDMRHMLFESTSQLVPSAPPTEIPALYENFNGHVRLAGVLPDGSPASSSTAGSGSSVEYRSVELTADARVEHAVSRDGSRVVFEAPADEGGPDAEQNGLPEVYDRIAGSETVELSTPASGATPKVSTSEPGTFWDASEDGSRVFFTSSAELTTESNTGAANSSEDLYEYNLQSKALTDLTVDTNVADESTGAMVHGVAGVSSDGSYVYFVAGGELVKGKGVDGEPNLYVEHNGGSPKFIATLTAADGSDWTQTASQSESYVTSDGKHLEFGSRVSLPSANFPKGYDNHDQASGEVDREIYEYTAAETEEASQLLCASCDPSGAKPVGDAFTSGNTAFSRARVVSENGARVFYTARTPLVPAIEKIFEYEQDGEDGCVDPLGCQYLLGGLSGTEDEQFLGASASGDDVFIATTAQLVPGDTDNLRDVYDVRVDGGVSLPPGESVCQSECRTPTSPATTSPTIVGATAGPSGNLRPPSPQRGAGSPPKTKCSKGHKRRHGRCVRVKSKSRAKVRAHNMGRTR